MTTAAPFFPLYLKDWMMDTRGFSHEDKGVLVDLLCFAWERGGLPTNPETVRKLAHCSATAWRRVWPTVQAGWIERDGQLIYPKLEVARLRMEERSAVAKAKAEKRWNECRSNAAAYAAADATASRQHGVSNAKQEAREDLPPTPLPLAVARSTAENDDEPTTRLRFPTVGPAVSWALTDAQVASWAALFPTLDVLAECRAALAWVLANPTKRKTARGMPSFLVSWLGRSNDRPRPAPGPLRVVPDNPKAADLIAAQDAKLAARAVTADPVVEAEMAAALRQRLERVSR